MSETHARYTAPVNNLPANLLALHWLRQAKAQHDPSLLYLLQLAVWGIEKGQRFQGNGIEPDQLESQVHALLSGQGNKGVEAAKVYRWLVTNPNGPTQPEQATALEKALRNSPDPLQAAAVVLETVSDRMAAASASIQE